MAGPEGTLEQQAARPAREDGHRREVSAPSLPEVPDEVLMQRYQKGDVRAFEQLLRRHQRPVFHFALRFLGQDEAAQDALQEIFLRVVKNAPRYERRAKFTTWLYTIARNHCIDASRKARYRRTSPLSVPVGGEEGGRSLEETIPGHEPEPDRSAHNRRLKQAIDNAIAALGEDQREVFILREHCGLAFKEIGDITGVPENTVKSRMRYALEKLREQLRAGGFEP
ncbi:MAG: RNA polymerase sigma factor [Deltaproteobacteria bacterium]|nr:RNA polymerase sigma factor [Deltaproteobacteria bacterium]